MHHPYVTKRKLPRTTALTLAVSLALVAGQAVAGTITVTSAADNHDVSDGLCTLREAVVEINQPVSVYSACSGEDEGQHNTIVFAPVLAGSTITLKSGNAYRQLDLWPDSNITIDGDINGDARADITVSGGDQTMILHVAAAATASLENINLTHGHASGASGLGQNGGAINNDGDLSLLRVSITDSVAPHSGGAIFNNASLTLRQSTISGNTADRGGGIFNAKPQTGTAEAYIYQSTISGNTAATRGGGLNNHSPAIIINSTFHANHAGTDGGAITAHFDDLTIRQSTISNNSADNGGGLWLPYWAGTVTVSNSIIAGNSPDNCDGFEGSGTADPNYIVAPYPNLLWPSTGFSCNVTNSIVADPALGALASQGGPTRTLLPGPTSMAVDTATCISGANAVTIDQRGIPRPQLITAPMDTNACDYGAVEVTWLDRHDVIFADDFE